MSDPKNDSSPQHSRGEDERAAMEAPEERSSGASRRLLLLMLLLVVAAGGAFYHFFGAAEPEPPQPARQVVSRPITMPVPPAPAPGGAERAQAEPSPSASSAAPEPTAPAPEATPQAPPPQAASPASEAAAEPPPAASPAAPPTMQQAKPPAASTPKGAFALQTAALVRPGELAEAERALRSLGYSPTRETVSETLQVTRLLLGVYPPDEAMPQLREVQAVIPGAFPLRVGDRVALYAGSFHDLDRARLFADELFEKGIRVEEQRADVAIDVSVLRFGAFADEGEAEAALLKVQSAGIESRLLRLP